VSHLPVVPHRGSGLLLGTLGIAVVWTLACGPIDFGDDATETAPSSGGASGARPVSADGGPAAAATPEAAPVECDTSMKVPRASGCAISTIACGETIEASNEGQAGHFDDAFYRQKFCTPRSNDYESSPEAVYALTVPANMKADVFLETPCDDLDLFSIRWPHADRCPSASTSTGECEGSTKDGADTVRIMSVGKDEKHLVWVDGKQGATGNFRLRVECRAAR